MLQEWPPVRRVAWACAEAAIEWRASALVWHQQTWRSLFAHLADPWRSRRFQPGRRQTRSTKPLAQQAAGTATSQCRGCRACQQERTDRVGHALRHTILRTRTVGESGLSAQPSEARTKEVPPKQLQRSAGDGETVTPSLPEPDVWTGMASANVSEPLRWKRAKIHRGSRRRLSSRIRKPDIRQQL